MGTGLGLTICRNLVQFLGGELLAESEVGKGTVFSFEIPLAVKSGYDTQLSDRQVKGLVENQDEYRILISDDHWENRAPVAKLLMENQYNMVITSLIAPCPFPIVLVITILY